MKKNNKKEEDDGIPIWVVFYLLIQKYKIKNFFNYIN